MSKNMIKRLAYLTLAGTMFCSSSIAIFGQETVAFTEEIVADTKTEMIGELIEYESPSMLTQEDPVENRLLISIEEINLMTDQELVRSLKDLTPLTDEEITQIVEYYRSEDFKNGISPAYGIYDHTEWSIKPYVKSSQKSVTYATSWIGIDAYRSAVGMSKGRTESKTISTKLGFTGSAEIKKYKPSLTAEFNFSTTTTVSESQVCPAWTTMNWRPYILYWIDTYYGKMKVTTIIPGAGGVYENVWYDELTGTDKRKITDTTEVWSRVNTKQSVNATTPTPPTGAPDVLK